MIILDPILYANPGGIQEEPAAQPGGQAGGVAGIPGWDQGKVTITPLQTKRIFPDGKNNKLLC